MPKASTKSTAKPRPKPRPVRSPKKQVSPKYIDDEAEESYEKDFIDDRDLAELTDIDSLRYPSPSPPPATVKSEAKRATGGTSTSKRASGKQVVPDAVIELDSTSEEDMAAMDEDDSVFKKPPGVKASALPPSLMTRSVASKLGVSIEPVASPSSSSKARTASSTSTASRDPVAAPSSSTAPSVPGLPFPMDDNMTKFVAFGDWMTAYLQSQKQLDGPETSSAVTQLAPSPSIKSPSSSRRVDHDKLALEQAIKRSAVESSSSPTPDLGSPRQLSPDWEPPYAGDLSPKRSADTDAKISKPVAKGKSKGKAKGKGKARQLSPPVSDASEDDVPVSPSKRSPAKVKVKAETPVQTDSSDIDVFVTPKKVASSAKISATVSSPSKSAASPKKLASAGKGKGKAPPPLHSDASESSESEHELPVTPVKKIKRSAQATSSNKRKKPIDSDGDHDRDAPSTPSPSKTVLPGRSAASFVVKRAKNDPSLDKDVSTFMVKKERPRVSVALASSSSAAGPSSSSVTVPLTMAQYARVAQGEPAIDDTDAGEVAVSPTGSISVVFLEDIQQYKVFFNSAAPCGVADPALQDPSLKGQFDHLHPLPAFRRILATFDRNRITLEDIDYTTGGHVQFSSWFAQNPRMLASNSMNAILFVEAGPNFINLSRVSPLRLSCRVSPGSSTTHRLFAEDRIAVCVSAICCTESYVVAARRVGAKSERQRKYISGVFHDQDWERFESIVCLVFSEQTMYGQIEGKAISFQTMISPDLRNAADAAPERPTNNVPSHMFSKGSPGKKPSPSKASSSRPSGPMKTLLAYNDIVPVYDARKTVIDFSSDLERLSDVLPIFPGEIPSGSFTVVGYTVASYMGAIGGGTERVPHVGCNILWAIVCGTPSPTRG
ncbi:hypothetical protein DFH06DRAFT_1336526 [Mycena polygramma]|nr:hypothetical protein DFH06DRAFT_1336526 [Mycena polygramma]